MSRRSNGQTMTEVNGVLDQATKAALLDEMLGEMSGDNRVQRLKELLAARKAHPASPAVPQPVPNGANGKPAATGKDSATGQFQPGNQCAKGRANPHARKQAALRAIFDEVFDADSMRRVAKVLRAMAREGDLLAIKLVLDYQLGKARKAPDPDRLDLEEFKLLDQTPTKAEFLRALVDSLPAELACTLLQTNFASPETKERLTETPADPRTLAQMGEVGARRCRKGK
jgi:hypothetical protein